ncbi:MAG: CCA tRNA nucleotidyltransferase [Treponemataceae bacterium]
MKIEIPQILKKMNKIFEKNGYQAYLVGGAVRDMLMNEKCEDWDIATDASPEQVKNIFHKVIPTGIEHGTVTVIFMGAKIEVTTFRTEDDYSDARHPDKVEYCRTIEQDLSRRDFTINAIAANLKDGSIIDIFNGIEDLKNGIIRTVGNPHERFIEDGLRPVRALRFAAKLSFCIQKDTYSEIFKQEILDKVSSISLERFRDELMKIMASKKPSIALKLMEETGIMKIFMSEMCVCRNCTQADDRGYHIFDVMDHSFFACDGAPQSKPLIRLAAFLHDSGKPESKKDKIENNLFISTFYNHERYSEKKARTIMNRLKFSNAEIEKVCHLIANHMFHYESSWTDSAVRRFMVRVGVENIKDLIDLRIADMYGKYNKPAYQYNQEGINLLDELIERTEKCKKENNALSLKDLKINGNDLISMGLKPGKQIGEILDKLFQSVLDNPEENTKEKLLKSAKKYIKTK